MEEFIEAYNNLCPRPASKKTTELNPISRVSPKKKISGFELIETPKSKNTYFGY